MTLNGDVTRIHERIDQVMTKLTEIAELQATMAATCVPCRTTLAAHELAINGNGIANGLKSRVATLEEAKPKEDTLSIKSVGWLIGIIGGLIGTIIGGVAMLLGRTPPPGTQ